jgi:hypothetical protein
MAQVAIMMTDSSVTHHVNSNVTEHVKDGSPWPAILKAALVASLVALLLLLGLTMVQHRFFRGGRVDTHGVLRP